jgi:phosphohistidine phosphatase
VKRLILLRHAKAVPMAPDLEDHDRVLAERGRNDAARMGQFLRDENLVPDMVLCSSAARTRQTVEVMLALWGTAPPLRELPELYLARWLTIINLVRQLREAADTLMVVGHNPGLEECARILSRPPDNGKTRKLQQLLVEDYPTAAVTVLRFEIALWNAVERGEGELETFMRPRDLA